jgi:putative oxidoreductase
VSSEKEAVTARGSRYRRAGTRFVLLATGRILLSGIFVHGGWSAFRDPGHRPQQAAKLGIPHPEPATTLTRANGVAMLMGGAGLGAGLMPRVTAAILAGSLVPTTFAGHRFWEQQDEQARRQQTIHFLKNAAMLGGLLIVIAEEPR